jgi:hypothetical protein
LALAAAAEQDDRGIIEPVDGRGVAMQAKVGDHLVVESNTVGSPRREGEILEVRGADGAPPYVVRWEDGHEGVNFPGPDARVTHPG